MKSRITIISNDQSHKDSYKPFSDNQFRDALIYSSNNSGKITVNIDEETQQTPSFEWIYSKTGLRTCSTDLYLNDCSIASVREQLIKLQNQIVYGNVDVFIINLSYNQLHTIPTVLQKINEIGLLIRLWKNQTEQISLCEIPVLIQFRKGVSTNRTPWDFKLISESLFKSL